MRGTKSCRTQGRISICLSVYPSICPYLCPASLGPSKSKSVHHGSHSSPFRYRPQRRGSKGQIWTLEVLGRMYIWTNRWTQILPCILQDFVHVTFKNENQGMGTADHMISLDYLFFFFFSSFFLPFLDAPALHLY